MLGKPHQALISITLALMPVMASALEYKSVAVPKAVLYDAPSSAAKKIYLLSQFYPVEIIVNLGDWMKVRDAQGGISWVEAKQLSAKRTVVVTTNTDIRQSPDANASIVATVDKDVILELVEADTNNGWLKVKHRDGVIGFVLLSATWGFN